MEITRHVYSLAKSALSEAEDNHYGISVAIALLTIGGREQCQVVCHLWEMAEQESIARGVTMSKILASPISETEYSLQVFGHKRKTYSGQFAAIDQRWN